MKKKIIKLVEKQGFIIFLFVCVCLVAGGTLYLSMKNLNIARENLGNDDLTILENEPVKESSSGEYSSFENISDIEMGSLYSDDKDESVQEVEDEQKTDKNKEESETQEEVEEVVEVSQVTEAEVSEEEDAKPESDDLKFEEDSDANFVEEASSFAMPIEGAIITEYTDDTLVYSDTLEAWIGHEAMDIKADEGGIVLAPMGGTIKKVYEDELWGIVIVIDHGNGLETKYANLSTKEMVKEGVRVEKGDHISKVGKTAKIEMHLDTHLHFEVRKDGKLIDPRSIMK